MGPKGGSLPKVGGGQQKVATSSKTTTTTTSKTNAKNSTEVTPKLPAISSPSKTVEEIVKEEEIKKAEEIVKEEEIKKAEEIAKAEEIKKAEEIAKAEEIKKAEEERKKRENGDIILIYEMYNEKFPIKDGSTTASEIDEVYCLSFVMPNCKIHLSVFSPTDKRKLEENGNIDVFVNEDPQGTYKGLASECTYYVYIEQEEEQLKRDQERMRRIAEGMEGAKKQGDDLIKPDDGRVMESCSCIYGNPCVDEYACKDWRNRFAVALANGWKGF